MKNQMVVWCEPFSQSCCGERNDARVRPDEIILALNDFRKRGIEPQTLFLNRKMIERLGGSFLEGIEIVEHNGVASWEIWADADNKISPRPVSETPAPPLNTPDSPLERKEVAVAPQHPISLPPKKRQHIQKEILTHHNPNPVKVVTKRGVTKPKSVTKGVTTVKRGQKKPKKKGVLVFKGMTPLDDRIKQLEGLGSCQAILGQLKKEGYKTNRMKIWRVLNPKVNKKEASWN